MAQYMQPYAINDAEDQPAKKRKTPGRTRAACSACRANKQRCDAQSSYPCRRCQLYGIVCELDSETAHGPNSAQAPAMPGQSDPAVGDKLQDIVERLSRIEFALAHPIPTQAQRLSGGSPGITPPGVPNGSDPTSPHSSSNITEPRPAVDTLAQSDDGPLQQVRKLTANFNALREDIDFQDPSPDAISRGIVTEEMAAELFAFHFKNLEPSVLPCAHSDLDDDPKIVRKKSPLLFNSILLSAAYYVFLGSDEGRAAYGALAQLEGELLGPAILFGRMKNGLLSVETIRALMLNCCRKPIHHANTVGTAVPLAVQFASKLDLVGAQIQLSVAIRMAYLLNMRKRVNDILDPRVTPAPTRVDMSLVRTWFIVCMVDTQGAFQSGRLPSVTALDDHSSLNRFIEIGGCKTDCRQASLVALASCGWDARVNLFEAARRSAGTAHHQRDIEYLRQYEVDYARQRAKWVPLVGADPIEYLICRFIRLVLFSKYITLWADEYRASGKERPFGVFSEEQRDIIRLAVKDASEALFSLSMDSRAPEMPEGRKLSWTLEAGTYGPNSRPNVKALLPDQEQIDWISRAIDTINCVVIPFFACFLVSHAGRSVDCNLENLPQTMILSGAEPRWINPNGKLRRILDLTADVLEVAAPNTTHPAVGHARMLRALIVKSMRAPEPDFATSMIELGGTDFDAKVRVESTQPALKGNFQASHMIADAYLAPFMQPEGSDSGFGSVGFDYSSLFGVDLNGVDWDNYPMADQPTTPSYTGPR